MPKTKIISTIGPASSNYTELRKMMIAGMDVIRINFSHGSHNEHLEKINLMRKLNLKYRRSIKILGDLEGYRIRIGKLGNPVNLKKNQILQLSNRISNKKDIVFFDFDDNLKKFKKGIEIYIDDGNIMLSVLEVKKNILKTKVVVPGILKSNKGIVIPDLKIDFKGIKEKDKNDIDFCIDNKIDFIAQSFVRDEKDIIEIKKYINSKKFNCKIIAKIENREGIENIDKIIKESDGILIARGDMGVSLPVWEVPIMQKIIIKKCREAKKIVITATQMLESMVENKRPTRAEVSDVANAILDGSDYVMLSAETAAGRHPALCVDVMNKIIKFTEKNIRKVC